VKFNLRVTADASLLCALRPTADLRAFLILSFVSMIWKSERKFLLQAWSLSPNLNWRSQFRPTALCWPCKLIACCASGDWRHRLDRAVQRRNLNRFVFDVNKALIDSLARPCTLHAAPGGFRPKPKPRRTVWAERGGRQFFPKCTTPSNERGGSGGAGKNGARVTHELIVMTEK
jgi:hypothetical protein